MSEKEVKSGDDKNNDGEDDSNVSNVNDSNAPKSVVLKKKKSGGVSKQQRKALLGSSGGGAVDLHKLMCDICHVTRSKAKVRYKGRDLFMCRKCVYQSQAALDEFGTISRNPLQQQFDRWGFFIGDRVENADQDKTSSAAAVATVVRSGPDLAKEQERSEKWRQMFEGEGGLGGPRNWGKCMERCCKGIPNSVRGAAWVFLALADPDKQRANVDEDRAQLHDTYRQLLKQSLKAKENEGKETETETEAGQEEDSGGGDPAPAGATASDSKTGKESEQIMSQIEKELEGFEYTGHPELGKAEAEQIGKDLPRTFPGHALFAERGGAGQRALQRVLELYAVHNKDLGYCQGMAMVVGVLLMYVAEEDAFAMLRTLCEADRFQLQRMWEPAMPALAEARDRTEELMIKLLPRLAGHFEEQGVMLGVAVDSWFLTWFLYSLPFDVTLRCWDLLLCHGGQFIHALVLSLLKLHEDALLSSNEEQIYELLRFAGGSGGAVGAAAAGANAAQSLNVDKLTSTAVQLFNKINKLK